MSIVYILTNPPSRGWSHRPLVRKAATEKLAALAESGGERGGRSVALRSGSATLLAIGAARLLSEQVVRVRAVHAGRRRGRREDGAVRLVRLEEAHQLRVEALGHVRLAGGEVLPHGARMVSTARAPNESV